MCPATRSRDQSDVHPVETSRGARFPDGATGSGRGRTARGRVPVAGGRGTAAWAGGVLPSWPVRARTLADRDRSCSAGPGARRHAGSGRRRRPSAIELTRADRDAFRKAAAADRPALTRCRRRTGEGGRSPRGHAAGRRARSGPRRHRCRRRRHDRGSGKGGRLQLADRLQGAPRSVRGAIDVVMTRDHDVFIPPRRAGAGLAGLRRPISSSPSMRIRSPRRRASGASPSTRARNRRPMQSPNVSPSTKTPPTPPRAWTAARLRRRWRTFSKTSRCARRAAFRTVSPASSRGK